MHIILGNLDQGLWYLYKAAIVWISKGSTFRTAFFVSSIKSRVSIIFWFCYRLRFSPDSAYLLCSSDQGTIHVFNSNPREEDFEREKKNMYVLGEPKRAHLSFSVDQLILKKGQYASLKKFTMPYAEHVSECAFVTKGDSNSNLVGFLTFLLSLNL